MNEQIIIAMKPLDKNFVNNALNEGVAGINIDESRIGLKGDKKISGGCQQKSRKKLGYGFDDKYEVKEDNSQGRFPSNIILQHHPECVKVGTKKIKGITGGGRKKSPVRKGGVHADYKGHQTIGREQSYVDYADDEGNETIEEWDCHPDCPIKIMDEQSGILHSGARDNRNNNPYKGPSGWKGTNAKGIYSSSSGGASRFFYQVKEKNMEGRFPSNIILQHHPDCVRIGDKKVKGHKGYPNGPGGIWRNEYQKEHKDATGFTQTSTKKDNEPWKGLADKDGNETIEDWNCHPECPIRILDEQSGILETHGTGKNPKMGNIGYGSNRGKINFQEYKSNSGGASRFFYQIKKIDELNIEETSMEVNNLFNEDCKETMKKMDKNSIPFIITDPPYLLEFMGKEFDKQHHLHEGENTGQKMQKWHTEWLKEAYRVLKPGGYIVAFGGTRTYHRLACAMEDVGFEIRDTMQWIYGSGFPKSLDISKAIDKRNGRDEIKRAELAKYLRNAIKNKGITLKELRIKLNHKMKGGGLIPHWITEKSQPTVPTKKDWVIIKDFLNLDDTWDWFIERIEAEREVIGKGKSGKTAIWQENGKMGKFDVTISTTPEAKKWEGWGTALKPAYEPIVIGMKSVSGSFVDNALNEGLAGINIDGSRVATDKKVDDMLRKVDRKERQSRDGSGFKNEYNELTGVRREDGRFPANVVLTHHEECKKIGTKKVKAHKGYVGEQNQIPGYGKGWHGKRIIMADSDKDGNETIEEWECHKDCPVRIMNEQSGDLKQTGRNKGKHTPSEHIGMYGGGSKTNNNNYFDSGGAARFYYTAKASKGERNVGLESVKRTYQIKEGTPKETVEKIKKYL